MIPKHAWSALLAYDDDERFSCFELPSDVRQTIIQQCPWITLKQLETLYRPADPEVFGPKPTQQGLIKLEKRYELDPMHNCYQHKWQYVHEFEDFWNNEIFIFRPTAERMRQLGLHESQFPSFTSFEDHTAPGETVKKGVGPGEAPPSEGDKKLCEYSVFKVSCDHKARQFKLDSAQDKPNDGSRYVYQVLAKAEEPDRIHIQYQGQCHGRDYAHPDCGGFKVTGPNMAHKDQDGNTFKVYAPKDKGCDDFATFLKLFLLPNSQAATYTAKPISCYNHGDADPVTIQAFSTVSWQSDLSLGGEVDENRHVNWGLHGNIQINSNQNTYKLGADTSTPLDSIFENVQSFMNELLPMLGCLDRYSNGALNIKVDPPQLKLEGNLKNVENPQGFNVDYQGSVAVKLDPLFALEGEVDIVQWIIDCFPETKAASFLQSIVEKSENSDSFDVSIKLSCQDRIEGYTKWSKEPQKKWEKEHDLADELELIIKGEVEAQGSVFGMHFSAGADLQANSGFKIEANPDVINGNLAIKPRLHFNGLHVKWAYHAHIGGSPDHPHQRGSSPNNDNSDSELEGETVHHSTLIDPKTWPDQVKPLYLNRGVL